MVIYLQYVLGRGSANCSPEARFSLQSVVVVYNPGKVFVFIHGCLGEKKQKNAIGCKAWYKIIKYCLPNKFVNPFSGYSSGIIGFHLRISFLIWNAEQKRKTVRIFFFSSCFTAQNVCNAQGWLRWNSGARNSIQAHYQEAGLTGPAQTPSCLGCLSHKWCFHPKFTTSTVPCSL